MNLLQKARLSRLATVVLLGTLIVLIALQTLAQPLPVLAATVLALLLVLPLAAFLPSLWRGQTRRALWFTLLLMPYFCWAILGAYAPGTAGALALLRAVLIAGCFAGALLMAHWQRKAALQAS